MKRWKEEVVEDAHDFSSPAHCAACMAAWTNGAKPVEEEPPLTAEEEEEVAGDEAVTAHADVDAMFEHLKEEPPPPQPDGRPPYAVAYSVQGHLYEVALPGDATVRAVDGALVITHRLGPVAAICQVLPITNEEAR